MSERPPNSHELKLDEQGFLLCAQDWSRAIAVQLAQREGITLDKPHWEIIEQVQQYYRQFDLSPAMRPLVKYLQYQLSADINSVYLLKLFPGNPAILASKIAGLPKPKNCF